VIFDKEPVMRVFVAGATGAIGRQLMPRLVAAGHEVHGMTRSESKQAMLDELGAVPVLADALDPDQVAEAVARAKPGVIVHQLTAIGAIDQRFERDFALTNRLRTEGTDHLLSAGGGGGAAVRGAEQRRVPVRTNRWGGEERRGPARPHAGARDAHDGGRDPPSRGGRARRRLDRGIVLRYGAFYGPGTPMTPGGAYFETIRERKFPIVGDGGGVWSFVHIADAAEATVAAVEHGSRGVYNVVDDDPAPVVEWLPALAQTLGAEEPMRVPPSVGLEFAGEWGVVQMTELRGASNAKAKRELGWRPAHASWRRGFATA
jgi:nucleoside-diphosphate-sugar epimerase